MTIAFAIFVIVGIACSIASVYFSIRTIRDTKKIIALLDYLSKHDRNYQNWLSDRQRNRKEK